MSDPRPRLLTIFTEALDRTELADRAAYLEQACGGDAALRGLAESLLAARAGAFDPGPHPPTTPHTEAHIPEGATGTLVEPDPDATGVQELPSPQPAATGRLAADSTIGGRYTLLGLIGEGGMGSVYLASQTEPVKRQVALKLIKPGMDSRAVLARFDAERPALALMDHPNIARVYDGGSTGSGQPFFVI